MIEQLFGSKTRVKLLRLFYSNPNRSFYVREITRKIEEQINSVRRELSNLLAVGIITSDTTNNRLYYEVSQKFEHYDSLFAMFGGTPKTAPRTKKKSPAAAGSGSVDIGSLGNVELALYTGQFTRDETSGIDMLVVGDVNQNKLQKFVMELEGQEGKNIRYTLFTLEEYNYRDQIHDRFLDSIKSAKKQILVDKQHLLS